VIATRLTFALCLLLLPGWAAAQAPDCASATDLATAADLRAATALAQRAEPPAQARLFDLSIGLWRQAVEACTGRARERAERNLADSQQARQSITDQHGSGEHCSSAQKDAGALQDLADRAEAEQRWQDAALLYRKVRARGKW
jgi:hypothetical protein